MESTPNPEAKKMDTRGCACIWTTGSIDSHLPNCTGPTQAAASASTFPAETLEQVVAEIAALAPGMLGVRDFDPQIVRVAQAEARRRGTTISALVSARRVVR